jgi:hypothetical protein
MLRASPVTIVRDYVDMLRVMAPLSVDWGVQLITLVGGQTTFLVACGVIALVVSASILGLLVRRIPWSKRLKPLAEYHSLVILVLLTLLVTYHRVYDVAAALLFVPLAWYASLRDSLWRPSTMQARLARAATLGFVCVLLLPGPALGILLSRTNTRRWVLLQLRAMQAALATALACSVWLLVRLRRACEPSSPAVDAPFSRV